MEPLKSIEDIIRTAGMMLKDNIPDSIRHKSGMANFATEWDVKIQQYLISSLSALYPDSSFYGEEDTEGNSREASSSRTFANVKHFFTGGGADKNLDCIYEILFAISITVVLLQKISLL